MKITAAQCSSTHLQRPRALARPLGERSEPLQLQGLCCSLFMQSAGRCQECYARRCVQCWSLLRSVTKLIKFKARFPFFVRQVFIFCLECVHVCKVLTIKGSQFGPQLGPRPGPQLDLSWTSNWTQNGVSKH